MISMSNIHRRGFTIVELLIVIVVIAILAVITIVAYNGIQQRARESTVKSDLSAVAKKMAIDNVNNGSYELAAGDVDEGKGLPASSGTTYEYASTGSTYCITATNGNVSYKISNTSPSPAPGGCSGHGVNGVAAITNYAANPSAVGSTGGFGQAGSGPVATTTTIATDRAHHGTTSLKREITGASGYTGAMARPPSGALVLATGERVNWSFWVYSTKAGTINIYIEGSKTADGTYAGAGGGTASIPANVWTKVSGSWTATLGMNVSQAGGYNLNVVAGDMVWFDEFMISKGSSLPNYADGTTENWIWNGTAHNATSTGPPV